MSKLGDHIEYVKGFAFKSKDYTETGIPVIRVSNFTDNSIDIKDVYHIPKERFSEFQKVNLIKDDIVIATVGSWPTNPSSVVGKTIRVPPEANNTLLNQNAVRIRSLDKDEQLYFYYVLKDKSFSDYIISTAQGSANQASITLKSILDYDLPNIDSKEKRIKIGKTLATYDEKIQLNTQINQTLEQIAQALFKSWFIDFDPVRAKVQALSDGLSLEQAELAAMQAISGKTPEELTALSQAEPECYAELAETTKAFPCEIVEVDGVEVPKGWEVKELGSLMTIKRGGSPRPIKDFISDKGLNWVKISDATAEDNPFLFSTKEYIKSEGLSKTVLLNKGSLILSNSATPGLPRFLELDACIHDGWLYFSDIKRLTQEYLYFFFLNIRNDLVAQGNGSVFTNLKTDIVKAQKAIVPDERVICYFDKQVKSIMNLIRYNTANSISLKETRDLLLPRLLNGEI
jgi:putative type-1 restriction enzyme hindVIIP specificity protein